MKKKIAMRILLGILILLNLWMIFGLSTQSSAQSDQTSIKVTYGIAHITVPDFSGMDAERQAEVVQSLHPTVRSLAHMAEFCSLGVLLLLLGLTFRGNPWLHAGGSLAAVVITASVDELYQKLSNSGRVGDIKDVLLDSLGGSLGCLFVLLCLYLHRYIRKRKQESSLKITQYRIINQKFQRPMRIALVSDLHDNPYGKVVEALRQSTPDMILIPGDLTDDEHINEGAEATLAFLRECVSLAPTFYSPGNHEIKCYHRGNPFRHPLPVPIPEDFRRAVSETGAVFLDNALFTDGTLTVCGLTSGICGKENRPDEATLERFRQDTGEVKLLLCHHPEYYVPYLRDIGADLVVCGHAHGGHWRIFGRGVYAPGQGLFPKYTSGVLNGNCVISRGVGDHTRIPRIFNPRELVIITLTAEK